VKWTLPFAFTLLLLVTCFFTLEIGRLRNRVEAAEAKAEALENHVNSPDASVARQFDKIERRVSELENPKPAFQRLTKD
jgi:multidrug resistance efflux pump